VVSSTKATSTVGFASACDNAAVTGNAMTASANAPTPNLNLLVMRDFIFPSKDSLQELVR